MHRTPMATAAYEHQKSLAYKKLVSRTQVPYRVMNLSSHTINIDKNEIPNTNSTDQATPDQNSIQQEEARSGHPIYLSSSDDPSTTPRPDYLQQRLLTNTEYVVDRIVANKKILSGSKYRVPWYGYTPSNNTFKPAAHIPSHFIKK